MANAALSAVFQQLVTVMAREVEQEVRLVIGVDKDVENLQSRSRTLRAVLVDADKRQVTQGGVEVWLDKLKDACYDMEDVLDEWNYSILKRQIKGLETSVVTPKINVCFHLPSCVCSLRKGILRRDIALKVKDLNEKFDDIAKEKETYNFEINNSRLVMPKRVPSTYFIDESKIAGRDEEKTTILNKLTEENGGLHIISLVGMGGIGKTTLAQLAYNNCEVKRSFDKRAWVCVSEPFDEFRIARAIIEGLEGFNSNLSELSSLLQQIFESIKTKKFLLVLDDLWTDDYNKWEPFFNCLKNSLPGSKILVTTRKDTVALMVKSADIIPIKELPDHECWLLFKQLAFHERSLAEYENLEEVGKKIVRKCKGLPIAIKTLGSLLRFKISREEWQRTLDSEMWNLEFEKGPLPPLF